VTLGVGGLRLEFKDNIKVNVKGICFEVVDYTKVSQARIQWQVFVNMVIDLP
jgi:hypothetical protein